MNRTQQGVSPELVNNFREQSTNFIDTLQNIKENISDTEVGRKLDVAITEVRQSRELVESRYNDNNHPR